ncbi:hypothetical protein [Nocardiopsis sp. CC223A]|nr:hypothetical protein [Nocardiopsis sp. CC223A]
MSCRVRTAMPGSLVPDAVLRDSNGFVKPRNLFGADEDWDRALDYH